MPKEGKEPKKITVERDADGHLTWKVKDKEIKIGSSAWERFKHSIKLFFSFATDYKVKHEQEVSDKVKRITDAFIACLNEELLVEKEAGLFLTIQARDTNLNDVNIKISSQEVELNDLQLDYANKGLQRDALSPARDKSSLDLANATIYERDRMILDDSNKMYSDHCAGRASHEASLGKKGSSKRASFIQYLKDEPKKLADRKLALGDYDLAKLQSDFDALDQPYKALERELKDLDAQIKVKEQALASLKQTQANLLLETDDILKARFGL